MNQHLVCRCLLPLVGLLVGCGGEKTSPTLKTRDGRRLAVVVGWVTLNGKPLKNAQVDFQCPGTRYSSAGTNDKGYFDLKFNYRTRGAPIGEHSVTIRQRGVRPLEPAYEPLPARYNSNTVLSAYVKEGRNVISFHLTSAEPDEEAVDLSEVIGLILLDGKPAAGARVEFVSEKYGKAVGRCDNEGRYELTHIRERRGAPTGLCRVRISLPDADGNETLRTEYNTNSEIHETVDKGPNDFVFSLVSE